MCSISGFHAPGGQSAAVLSAMLDRTRHRGPDSVGMYLDGEMRRGRDLRGLGDLAGWTGRLGLGQARLEIVGGPEAQQPLEGCRPGWAVIHNGEIYNYKALRTLLGERHRLRTASDSELLIHLVEDYFQGDLAAAVRKATPLLDGMFSFAITDGTQLVVSRDPMGKKPVYFTTDGDVLAFASERKAIVGLGKSIRRLVPGSILVAGGPRPHVIRSRRFERPAIDITDFDDALAQYGPAFRRAVAKRVDGLRQVGCLFSGGIDSVLVAQGARQAGAALTAYCVGLSGSGDLRAARQAAETMGLTVRCAELSEEDIERLLPEIIEHIELNGAIQIEAAVPMYVAARMCAEDGHKVMLSGQAADELFAGYAWYRTVVRDEGFAVLHDRLWDDIEKLYLDTLEREDRMAMAHSIELRAPFLDRGMVHLAMRMAPERIKLEGPEDLFGKRVHRRYALDAGVPRELAYREKSRAQDGTGIHDAIRRIAKRNKPAAKAGAAPLLDYGSNYRYLKEDYAGREVDAYLAGITESHQIGAIGTANEEDYPMETAG